LLLWGALSGKRTGPSFIITADPRQRSHSRARVPWDSRPYFTALDSRLHFLSPPCYVVATRSFLCVVTCVSVATGCVFTKPLCTNGIFRVATGTYLAKHCLADVHIPAFRRHVKILLSEGCRCGLPFKTLSECEVRVMDQRCLADVHIPAFRRHVKILFSEGCRCGLPFKTLSESEVRVMYPESERNS
jgi:hypothetical protein